jgi:homoserine O-acetyltransferase/O-succinyltransferase
MTAGGAWRLGDPVGRRRFAELAGLNLEAGGQLPDLTMAYQTWGELNPARDNAVLVLHALTGDSHVSGPAEPGHGAAGWWDQLVGPGRALDTRQWFVVAPNVLGGCQGTTGPSSLASDGRAWGPRFPFVTIRDQVRAELALADALAIAEWAAVIGGSMGGMRALEWSVMAPDRVKTAVVLASTAAATAEQIAWCQAQILAITGDPEWRGGNYHGQPGPGPLAGLGLARRIAHITYRSEPELAQRFGRTPQGTEQPLGHGGRYAIESYLDHQAHKIGRRFDAGSYITLSQAMNSHDVGRDRGGLAGALSRITAQLFVGAVTSDRLYPLRLSRQLCAAAPTGSVLTEIHSAYGHDGFLVETEQVAAILQQALPTATRPRAEATVGSPEHS